MSILEQPMKVALVALLVSLLALLPSSTALSYDGQDTMHTLSPLEHDLRHLVLDEVASSPSSFMETAMSVGAAKYHEHCTDAQLTILEGKLSSTDLSKTITENDLICYYASPKFNLKGIYGMGGSDTCKNGIHLPNAAKGDNFQTFGEDELNTLKKLIFDVSRDEGGSHVDVATTTTLVTVKRSFSSQRVVLFLFDADTGCTYPVAHNVYPSATKDAPHTEAILKTVGLLDRDGMLSVIYKLYDTDLTSAKNLVRVLYTWYAPCQNCSETLMTKYAATTGAAQFKGNVILFNRAVCNGVKDYRAQCLAVTANYDAKLTSLHQIMAGGSTGASSENLNTAAARLRLNDAKAKTIASTASKLQARSKKIRKAAKVAKVVDLKTRRTNVRLKGHVIVKKGEDEKTAISAALRKKKALQKAKKKE